VHVDGVDVVVPLRIGLSVVGFEREEREERQYGAGVAQLA